ncbi:hypothetical protein, partial [Burkholderia humptydooensis]
IPSLSDATLCYKKVPVATREVAYIAIHFEAFVAVTSRRARPTVAHRRMTAATRNERVVPMRWRNPAMADGDSR